MRTRRAALVCTVSMVLWSQGAAGQAVPRRGAAPRVERLPDSVATRLLTPLLAEGERLEGPAFIGPIGPGGRAVFATIRTPEQEGAHPDLGALVLADTAGTPRVSRVTAMNRGSLFPEELTAVMFENLDADPALEVIVMATYISGIGPNGAHPNPYNFVLDWTGERWVHLPDVERRIAELATVREIRRVLRAPRP